MARAQCNSRYLACVVLIRCRYCRLASERLGLSIAAAVIQRRTETGQVKQIHCAMASFCLVHASWPLAIR